MKTWLILGLFGVFGLTSSLGPLDKRFSVTSTRGPAATKYPSNFNPNKKEFDFADLTSALKTHSFSKMDELLAYVKERDPEFMSRYVTAYGSKSLHESSKEYPRMIVFGDTAKTILTFNGHEKQVSYNLLEVMHFNEKTKKFEFYEIEFRENGDLKEPYTISENGGPDGKCLACHTNGRPIWHNYGLWPGMYGEEDDYPIYKGDHNNFAKTVLSAGIPGVQERLEKEWADFKAVTMTKPRYRQLKPLAVSMVDPITEAPRPNSDLTAALYHLNYKRIGEELKHSSAMKSPVREKLLYAGFCQNQDFVFTANEIVDLYNKYSRVHKKNLYEMAMTELKEVSFNMSIDWKDIQKNYSHLSDAKDEHDFFYKFLQVTTKTAQTSHYGIRVRDTMPKAAFLASVEKFVPEIDISNWPLNFVPGTQIYNDGLPESTFEAMIYEALFLEEEKSEELRARLVGSFPSSRGGWCVEMEKKLNYYKTNAELDVIFKDFDYEKWGEEEIRDALSP